MSAKDTVIKPTSSTVPNSVSKSKMLQDYVENANRNIIHLLSISLKFFNLNMLIRLALIS